jgi:hypothetical protein
MKSILSAILLFLISLPVLAAEMNAADGPPPIEPLSTGYVVFLVVVVVAVFAGFWRYYSRPEPGDDNSKQNQQRRD